MRISMQDRVRAYPRQKTTRLERVEPITPISRVHRIKDNDEKVPGEAFIISETAELLMKIFVLGIAPIYVIWLVIQALRWCIG